MPTRQEHLDFCKARALAYLPDDPQKAFTSMGSDLNSHPETKGHSAMEMGMMMLMNGQLDEATQMAAFIRGFN